MAGRIRTIKPEMLDNERTASLSGDAYKLWIGCILLADDYGNFAANPGRLHGNVFWARAPETPALDLLKEIVKAKLVRLYTVDKLQYASIVGWDEHQRVDKPGKPRVPGHHKSDVSNTSDDSSRETRESSENIPESLAPDLRPPTSDRDLRETSDAQAPLELTPPVSDPKPKALGEPETAAQRKRVDQFYQEASALLEYLNQERKAACPKKHGYTPTYENLDAISDRLSRGATPTEIRHVIDVARAEVEAGNDPKWFNPATPFGTNWVRNIGADPNDIRARAQRNGKGSPAPVSNGSKLPSSDDVMKRIFPNGGGPRL